MSGRMIPRDAGWVRCAVGLGGLLLILTLLGAPLASRADPASPSPLVVALPDDRAP